MLSFILLQYKMRSNILKILNKVAIITIKTYLNRYIHIILTTTLKRYY